MKFIEIMKLWYNKNKNKWEKSFEDVKGPSIVSENFIFIIKENLIKCCNMVITWKKMNLGPQKAPNNLWEYILSNSCDQKIKKLI